MTAAYRILIAEDEENVGIALQAMLRAEYPNSAITLVGDGQAAWETLQGEEYHLVIADWNMPRKTGDELLIDVRGDARTRRLPFIMLTARSDKDSVITAIQAGVTDYVRKPFEKRALLEKSRKLLSTVQPTAASGAAASAAPAPSQATSGPIEEIARRLKAGETGFLILPDLAMKIQDILKSEDVSVELLAEAIKLDPSLTVRLMAIANSSYYRADQECKTLKNAILRIGIKETGDVVFALATKDLFKSDSTIFGDLLQRIWEHSLAVGCCAGILANRLKIKSSESYYTMGLLHDIGKLLLINILKDLYKSGRLLNPEMIKQVLDTYHQQFGAELLKKWNFSPPFIELVTHHHDPQYLARCAQGLMLVGVANFLVRRIGLSTEPAHEDDLAGLDLQALLGLDEAQIEEVLDEAKRYVAEVKSLL